MKYLIKDITLMLGVILILIGFSMCQDRPSALVDDHPQMQYRDTAITLIKQFETLEDIANHLSGSQDSAMIMARALTIAPGEAWTWITDPDSLTSKGFAILSQNKYNRTEWVVTDTAMRGFISIVANDSIALNMSISNDTLTINDSSILLTAYRDTLNLSNDTLYISGQNYVLLSDYLDNTDAQTLSFSNPNLSISGGNSVDLSSLSAGGSFSSFYFNNGSTITEITDGDTLTHTGGGSGGVSQSGSISSTVQDMIDTFGIAAVYTTGSTITRANTTATTTLHQYYIDFGSSTIYYYGAGTLEINAIFAYTEGSTYYLQDNGRLANTADNDGDAQDFDSAVLYVVADLGSGNYIVNLADPRHFIN